jgi:hypothetical protein
LQQRNASLRYVAYGSNLLPQRLQRRVPSARLLGTADIAGWALRFNKRGQDGSGKCNIVPFESRIHVAVYQMLVKERSQLDRIEGLNAGYHGVELDVPGFGVCYCYRASASHVDDTVAPFCWYKELVVAGCRFHEFPAAYVDAIGEQPHVPDADEARREEHVRIVTASL